MSFSSFSDDCAGCRPAVFDPKTGKVYDSDSPVMIAVMKVWAQTSLEERKAFHDICCLNSRDKKDLDLMAVVHAKIQAALETVN